MASVEHKLRLVLWGAAMECPKPLYDWMSVLLAGVRSFCTDMGTESLLGTVPSINVSKVFQHWNASVVSESADDPEEELPDINGSWVTMNQGLRVPGAEHLCHTIESGVSAKLLC